MSLLGQSTFSIMIMKSYSNLDPLHWYEGKMHLPSCFCLWLLGHDESLWASQPASPQCGNMQEELQTLGPGGFIHSPSINWQSIRPLNGSSDPFPPNMLPYYFGFSSQIVQQLSRRWASGFQSALLCFPISYQLKTIPVSKTTHTSHYPCPCYGHTFGPALTFIYVGIRTDPWLSGRDTRGGWWGEL